jgi:hypothetical protein
VIQKKVSISFVIAYATWAAALGVWAVSWAIDSAHLGHLAILIGMAATMATIRLWMCDSVRDVENTIRIVREVEATDLDSVRPLR